MLDWIFELITNPFLITAVFSWVIAQVAKAIIYYILNRKISLERLFGDGGMPSGHSATVCSVAALSLLMCGPGSYEFAISTLLAVIVCHDAMGVRREVGKHAILTNEMIAILEKLTKNRDISEIELKEFVGHTPLQVLIGGCIGIASAVIAWLIWFRW